MAKKRSIARQTARGFSSQQKAGIFLLILSLILPNLLFKQADCGIINVFCHAQNLAFGSSSFILTVALAGLGIWMMATGGRR